MVIRGNSRGNGRQLAHYLLQQKDNEHIRILDIDGQQNPDDKELHNALFDMSVTAELTKSQKGLYHAQINPDTEASQSMKDKDWLEASDILGKQLGMENQRRAIVLHTKKSRTHAHVVWERYDHEQGKMVSDSFSRLAQDRARKEMEAVFEHKPTPHRNQHRPELRASLLQLWNQTATGAQFVKACKENNYLIAEGSGRSPYVVVDENGRSYDLARQLKGVKLKDVRQRLRHETLLGEKDAIIIQRNAKNDSDSETGKDTGKQEQKTSPKIKPASMSNEPQEQKKGSQQATSLQQQFQQNQTVTGGYSNSHVAQEQAQKQEQQDKQAKAEQQQKGQEQKAEQKPEQKQHPEPDKQEQRKKEFSENKQQATDKKPAQEQKQSGPSQGKVDWVFGNSSTANDNAKTAQKPQTPGQQRPAQSRQQQFSENKQQATQPKQQQAAQPSQAQQPQSTPQQQFAENKEQATGQQPEQAAPQPSQKQEFGDNKHEATGQDNIKEQFAENKEATEKQGQQEDDSEKRREAFRQRAEERKQRRTRGRGPSR